MAIIIKKKAKSPAPEPLVQPEPKSSHGRMLDGQCKMVIERYPNATISWWLMASYAYYIHDIQIISDGLYDQMARDMLARVGLAERLHHYPKHLSGGEQQRVALARAFVVRPKLLFADEPTGSLDAESGAAVIRLLFEMNREYGTTLVLVTHDEQLAARCQRIVRLQGGRIVQ